MSADRAKTLVQAWPDGPLGLHPEGLLWTQPCAVDPDALLTRWQKEAAQNDRLRCLAALVAGLQSQGDAWLAVDSDGHVIAKAATVVMCLGFRSSKMSFTVPRTSLPEAHAESSRSHAIEPWLAAAGWQLRDGHCSRSRQPLVSVPQVVGLQGEGHQIPMPDGHLLYGPRGREAHDAPGDLQALHPAVRASVRDHLPLVGALPDLEALHVRWSALRRNDRLPIPRHDGLWMLSALGGRGLLWCLPAAEHLAAQITHEVSLLDTGLSAALDPARFLRRALRSGVADLTHALGLA